MDTHYFTPPPAELSADARREWEERLRVAQGAVGMDEGGVPTATADTLALLDRYVRGELGWAQVVAVQQRRLG